MCSPRPASGRQGMLLPVEDDKWQLILTGLQGDHPPTDEEGYLEFARSLPSPEIYDALTQAEPLGPIHVFNRTENVKRFYGQVGLVHSLSLSAQARLSSQAHLVDKESAGQVLWDLHPILCMLSDCILCKTSHRSGMLSRPLVR